ncbi:Ig-like domain-containing protein, partial [Paenibacillus glacialis]|uniref:Ig-like domain-containing protein n=1 Tax=Paenibacillus glacialis TaxID=494026 RepID=UPI000B2AAB0E
MRIILDKKLTIRLGLSILLAITLLCVRIASAADDVVETLPLPVFKAPHLVGANPGKRQKWIIPVRSWKQSHLKATLYQSDAREWYYDLAPNHYGPFANLSTPSGDVPVFTDVDAVIELESPTYNPDKVFEDTLGRDYPIAKVPRQHRDVEYIKAFKRRGDSIPPTVSRFSKGNGTFTTRMHLGGNTTGDRGTFGTKSHMTYFINLDILWEGTIEETKEIFVIADAVLRVNGTKQEKATVKTQATEGGNWISTDVTTRSETEWKSSNESVATVSPTGLVTAVARGQTTITATWKSGVYTLTDSATITVGEDPPTDPDPSVECTDPSPGETMNGLDFDPNVNAVIRADTRDNEEFDVLLGIPT